MRKFARLAVAGAIVLGATTVAKAESRNRPCTAAPQSQWLSLGALHAKIEALGYKVQKAKLENACAEMHTVDKNGARAELLIDPATGEIISGEFAHHGILDIFEDD
jgi:hypothetical protein